MEYTFHYLVDTVRLISESRFGSKLVLKGGTVLMSLLNECNRQDLARITRDIDIHCDSRDVWIDFYRNVESILNSNKLGYVYRLVKRRSKEKGLNISDSLQFILDDHGHQVSFKIDMNIKANSIISVAFSPSLNMSTYDVYTMASDKIAVISSRSVYRRIKDLYDLSVLFSIYNFSYKQLCARVAIKHSGIELQNMLVPENYHELQHAFDKFDGIGIKPSFELLYTSGMIIMEPFYMGYKGELIWSTSLVRWGTP